MALKKRGESQFKLDINTTILDLMILYCYSTNENVGLKGLSNLHSLILKVDSTKYSEVYDISIRLTILKYTLDAIINERIREAELIKAYVSNNLPNQNERDDMNLLLDALEESGEMSNSDVEYINNFVAERLTNMHLYKYQDQLERALSDLQTGSGSITALNRKFENIVSSMYKDIRTAKEACDSSGMMDFSLRDETSFEFTCAQTIKDLNKPNNFIKTGIKRLNSMLGGGFESGRCYVAMGLPKKFKSGFLLNSALWATKYNQEVLTKDPTKKPCVVYISMENSVKETLQRVYHYCTGENIREASPREAMGKVMQELSIEGDRVDLKIWYRPNMSISTLDLDGMLDDLASEGLECVMLIQDYLERIRPSTYTGELRIDLGTIVNDFCVSAKMRDIPVLTASQLNREAMKILEQFQNSNRNDMAKMLGGSNVGESINIIKNADCAFVVNKEYSTQQDSSYLSFKMVACRYNDSSDGLYFAQPFVHGNGMRLKEDLRLAKSESIDSIQELVGDFNPDGTKQVVATGGASRFNNSTTKKGNDFFKKGGNLSEADFNDI